MGSGTVRKAVAWLGAFGLLALGLVLHTQTSRSPAENGEDMSGSSSHRAGQDQAEQPSAAHVNRLAAETSPYLLQHASNPVDWYPWGEDALRRARDENKPIFLSIGYSSCHWCHVMEKESFEDPAIAAILNAHFIPVKVDREERPDLDEIYMTAVQMMTGRGGWPLSVFLTPDLEPFYGGTYFPAEDRYGLPGFKTVLGAVADAWRTKPDQVAEVADRMERALRENAAPESSGSGRLEASVLRRAVAELRQEFDPRWGGFGGAPKFPPSGAITLLLREHAHTGEPDLLPMATTTLDRMAYGGIHDQIGGGFHRYSVDAQWLVPHFEKMLYDNAILAKVYLEAWQATGKDLYRQVAVGIFEYVLRDMTDPRGGFHSAEDADSEGEEGKFYLWRPDEIKAVLGDEDGQLLCEYYGVSAQGNFEGRNILHVPGDPAESAHSQGISETQLHERLALWRQKLLEARSNRVRPGKDDKVLAAWNGMMISALARGYQVLGERRYLEAAQQAADFVLREMVGRGTLLRTYRAVQCAPASGVSKLPAYLDDYAEMAGALVDLYEASFDLRWLESADELAGKMVNDFWDADGGGFFYTSAEHKDVLVRTKPFFDGAVPSGNAAATLVLLRLSTLLDNEDYRTKAETALGLISDRMRAQPRAHLDMLRAADFQLRPPSEIAIAGRAQSDETAKLLKVIHGRFVPNKILGLVYPDGPDAEAVAERIPFLRNKQMLSGKATVYVCEGFACKQPVNDAAALAEILAAGPAVK